MGDRPRVDLGLLEEDDDFEEFPAEGEIGFVLQWISFICNLYLYIVNGCLYLYLFILIFDDKFHMCMIHGM
jgi:hypothetical protein